MGHNRIGAALGQAMDPMVMGRVHLVVGPEHCEELGHHLDPDVLMSQAILKTKQQEFKVVLQIMWLSDPEQKQLTQEGRISEANVVLLNSPRSIIREKVPHCCVNQATR